MVIHTCTHKFMHNLILSYEGYVLEIILQLRECIRLNTIIQFTYMYYKAKHSYVYMPYTLSIAVYNSYNTLHSIYCS